MRLRQLWASITPEPGPGRERGTESCGRNIYALAINNGGIIRADTIVTQGGRILLRASGGNIPEYRSP